MLRHPRLPTRPGHLLRHRERLRPSTIPSDRRAGPWDYASFCLLAASSCPQLAVILFSLAEANFFPLFLRLFLAFSAAHGGILGTLKETN